MNIVIIAIVKLTDNVTYISGERSVDRRTSSNVEPDVYEVPVSTGQRERAAVHEYELTGSSYAAPYEYATSGPNEEFMVN